MSSLKQCVALIILAVPFWLPFDGHAGFIGTVMDRHAFTVRPGQIGMSFDIRNTGNATAYHVGATILLEEWAKRYDDLGHNPAGGKICLSGEFRDPTLRPGTYTAVVMINFEERNGRPHRVYHFFEIHYPGHQTGGDGPALDLDMASPSFNRKALRHFRNSLRLSMKNGHPKPVSVRLSIFLPDGFTARSPENLIELAPGREEIVLLPIAMDPSGGQDPVYHVLLRYHHGGIHYSRHLEGKINVTERPVFFKWYLLLGALALVTHLLLLVCGTLKKRARDSENRAGA